jgi:hypothetical protein
VAQAKPACERAETRNSQVPGSSSRIKALAVETGMEEDWPIEFCVEEFGASKEMGIVRISSFRGQNGQG